MLAGKKCFSCTERHKADLRCGYMWNDELSLQKCNCEVSFSERSDFIWRQCWPLSTQNEVISVFSALFHPFFCRVIADRTAHLQYVDLALSPSWPERFTKTRVGCRGKGKKTDRNISLLLYRLLLFISILLLSASFPLSLWPFHRIDQRHQQQNREQKTLCDILAGEKEGGRKRDTEREDQRIGDRVGNEMERKEG